MMDRLSARVVNELFFLELQPAVGLVSFQEFAQIRRGFEQANPLLVIQRDGKAAQPVHADPAFFAHAKFECAGAAAPSLFFQLGDTCFQFFIRWIGHDGSLQKRTWGRLYRSTLEKSTSRTGYDWVRHKPHPQKTGLDSLNGLATFVERSYDE